MGALKKRIRKAFGIVKPYALPLGDWDKWETACKKERPVGYFLTETIPQFGRNLHAHTIGNWSSVCYYINHRYLYKKHYMETGLIPGKYHDYGDRLLYSAFNEMTKHVEIERASQMIPYKDEPNTFNYPKWRKFFPRHYVPFIPPWRCAEAGIANLKLEVDDRLRYGGAAGDGSAQAHNAVELMMLYMWWTQVRPNRVDPSDASGLTEFWNQRRDKYDNMSSLPDMTPKERKVYDKARAEDQKLITAYFEEDEQMLVRLVKIRWSLWT